MKMIKVLVTSLSHLMLILLSFSCMSKIDHIPGRTTTSILDFSEFTKRGFLITPYKYEGKYESIGMIYIEIIPGASRHKRKVVRNNVSHGYQFAEWTQEEITTKDALESMYKTAKEMGADAIVDFHINQTEKEYEYSGVRTTLKGLELSGYAIKRIE